MQWYSRYVGGNLELELRFLHQSVWRACLTTFTSLRRLDFQQEVGQFQNRLSRAMQECQDKARDQMKPGYENDAKLMANVENTLISCIEITVNEYIGKLKPMKERIAAQVRK
jgi:Eukaryotic protein of unknown function (DUF842)